MFASVRRLLMATAVLVISSAATASACPPMISCSDPEDDPCYGELDWGFKLDTYSFTIFEIFEIYTGTAGFCAMYCGYRMTGAEGETWYMHLFDAGCNGSGWQVSVY